MRITLTRPDDWHLHLRDGGAMRSVAPHTARQFARAVIMPNLKPPVTTTEQAIAYRQRIIAALPAQSDFNPLMTLYLTDHTAPEEIQRAKRANVVACKLYPAGATTHSDAGVTGIENIYPVLEAMEKMGMLLLVHGEVTDQAVDIFDREAVFIERVLRPAVNRFPGLKIVFEHVTTRDAVDFVRAAPPTVAATITAHHLLYNRNALFQGGVRPHHYCLPILKRETHRQALIAAAISGHPKFFLGTDSAPHARHSKETDCGCAGCYTAHGAMEFYAEAFDNAGALDRLEGFASFFGPAFYGLPRNEGTITLIKETTPIPETFEFGKHTLVPLRAGETISWRLQEASNS